MNQNVEGVLSNESDFFLLVVGEILFFRPDMALHGWLTGGETSSILSIIY